MNSGAANSADELAQVRAERDTALLLAAQRMEQISQLARQRDKARQDFAAFRRRMIMAASTL